MSVIPLINSTNMLRGQTSELGETPGQIGERWRNFVRCPQQRS
jgi:hypothetical protein